MFYVRSVVSAIPRDVKRILTLFNMSHDIRTPLNGIIGMVNMGNQYADDPQMQQKIMQMQQQMAKAQEDVENTDFTASAGGGAVEVTVNGRHEAVSIKMAPEIIDPEEPEMLEDLIIAAFNESVRKANDAMEQGMERAKGGLSIPGLF